MQQFEQKLKGAAHDENEQEQIIKEYLFKLSDNHHSFRSYLLDELSKLDNGDKWEKYYSRPIVYATGLLFRETLQAPAKAFGRGMRGGQSPNVEDYANDTSGGTGLSTTKDFDVARQYSCSSFQTARGAHMEYGYIYFINYRGSGGVDIIETHKKRGNDFLVGVAKHKGEVNIIGKVDKEDIIGCIEARTVKYIPNPNYETTLYEKLTDETASAKDIIAYYQDDFNPLPKQFSESGVRELSCLF